MSFDLGNVLQRKTEVNFKFNNLLTTKYLTVHLRMNVGATLISVKGFAWGIVYGNTSDMVTGLILAGFFFLWGVIYYLILIK